MLRIGNRIATDSNAIESPVRNLLHRLLTEDLIRKPRMPSRVTYLRERMMQQPLVEGYE